MSVWHSLVNQDPGDVCEGRSAEPSNGGLMDRLDALAVQAVDERSCGDPESTNAYQS